MRLTIGQAARAAGIGVETVRYYERRKLIAEPERSPAGYRQYTESDVQRLKFIVGAKRLGFTLTEISELLGFRAVEGACDEVRERAERKISDIDDRIRQLRAFQTALTSLVAQCEGSAAPTECPILAAIEGS